MGEWKMEEKVETYFSSLNSMAKRIIVDGRSLRESSYRGWWNRVASDAFVEPRVVEKYAYYPFDKPDVESFPRLGVRSGEKYVVDEDNQGKGSGCTWRDEHSGPFTWETQSQLDISFGDGKETTSKENEGQERSRPPHLTKMMVKQMNGKCFDKPPAPRNRPTKGPPPKPPATRDTDGVKAQEKATRLAKVQVLPVAKVAAHSKTEAAEETATEVVVVVPEKIVSGAHRIIEQSLTQEEEDSIPKSGFDFLDNW